MASGIVTWAYYALVAYVVVLILRNLARAKSWERELLYVAVLIPFLLRLLRLK